MTATMVADQFAGSARRNEIITCREVRVRFGKFEALRGVSLSVRRGEVVCIVGPSGGGKSTFLRTLNGLQHFDSGTVVVNGITLPGTKGDIQAVRRTVGMVFQSFNLFPHLTVRDNLTLAPTTTGALSGHEANEKAALLLTRVGIMDQIDKYPAQLSGGQQQRVAIARALAMEPSILLFDEPTSALDPEMIKEVLDVISELSHTGITMLVVTHEMGFTRKVADRVVFMCEGQVLTDTSPEEFFSRPKDDRQMSFLGKVLH